MKRTLGVVAMVASALVLGVPAAGNPAVSQGERRTFSAVGCEELGFFVAADADAVREYVPAEFAMSGEETGEVQLLVGVVSCEDYTVNGIPRGPGISSDVGVLVDSPDGTMDLHVYQLWAHSTVKQFAAMISSVGIEGALIKGIRYDSDATVCTTICPPPIVKAEARVPWKLGDYAVQSQSAGSGAAAPPLRSATWWHLTPLGLATVRYEFEPRWVQVATGDVTTTGAGDRMRELVGTDTAEGTGILWTFDMEGTAGRE